MHIAGTLPELSASEPSRQGKAIGEQGLLCFADCVHWLVTMTLAETVTVKGKVTVMLVVTVTVSVTVMVTVTVIVTIWRKDAVPVCAGRMCTKWRSLCLGEGRTYHSMTSGEGLPGTPVVYRLVFRGPGAGRGKPLMKYEEGVVRIWQCFDPVE